MLKLRKVSALKFGYQPLQAMVFGLVAATGICVAADQNIGATARILEIHQQTRQLPLDDSTIRLRAVADQLLDAERALAREIEAMSPRERAMAAVQIDIAAEKLQVALAEQGGRSGLAVASAQRAADEASASAARRGTRRRVEVTVEPAAVLEVYAVPLGVLQYVGTLSDAKLRTLLDLGRFPNPTTPSADTLETGGDYAVWVAPPGRLDAVMQLLRQHGLQPYRTVTGRADAAVALRFVGETDRVRLPAAPQTAEKGASTP